MTAQRTTGATLVFGLLLLGSVSAYAIEKCQVCHSRKDLTRTEETGRIISLYVDTTILAASVHPNRECTDCHVDVVAIPHQSVAKVNCRRCHYSGNPVGAPEGEMYYEYEHSVHGTEVLAGNKRAPICQDCHGNHNVQHPDSASSSMNDRNIPTTCGRCHVDIAATYHLSVHGQALFNGILDAPDCADCHGEHNIQRHGDPTSRVAPANVAHTCAKCHGPVGVVSKYGIRTDRTATYEESFHGIAQSMQYTTVANCASCHGFHDILPSENPLSSINPANIVATCGREDCHPEATAQFARGRIHVDPTKEESGLVYYVTKFFTILTVSVLAGLFLFVLMDLYRRARNARQQRREQT